MKIIVVLAYISFLFTGPVVAAKVPNTIPDNYYFIPDQSLKEAETITEEEFNQVALKLYKLYAPKIKEKGNVELVINADWSDSNVNAFATREVESWTVHVSGGIARAKGMTKDSLAVIICHELGHHLGGAPRTYRYDGWPSAEGQADYWATSKCLKSYYNDLLNEEVIIDEKVPVKIMSECRHAYKSSSDLKICIRSMFASLDFANFLNALPGVKIPVSLDSFDARQIKGTNLNDYPKPQCRFDTLFSGALCNIASDVATSDTDAKIGQCNDITKPGTRPRCWYKPKD